jgi:hypothetical protein
MKEAVKRINVEYGLNPTEGEIDAISWDLNRIVADWSWRTDR